MIQGVSPKALCNLYKLSKLRPVFLNLLLKASLAHHQPQKKKFFAQLLGTSSIAIIIPIGIIYNVA
ncbi:hypothetical protein A4S05_16550 [Nostoc sp. KVJ20]|nr:hypothetical protein A4S05_16550 [Nostoc sp. KVJ20]